MKLDLSIHQAFEELHMNEKLYGVGLLYGKDELFACVPLQERAPGYSEISEQSLTDAYMLLLKKKKIVPSKKRWAEHALRGLLFYQPFRGRCAMSATNIASLKVIAKQSKQPVLGIIFNRDGESSAWMVQ